jgi:hypothetical protein
MRVERDGLYPTIRNRLHGVMPWDMSQAAAKSAARFERAGSPAHLEDLDTGRISADEAMRL